MVTGQSAIYRLVTCNTAIDDMPGAIAFGQSDKYVVKAAVWLETGYCIRIRIIPGDAWAMLAGNTPCIMKYEPFYWTCGQTFQHPDLVRVWLGIEITAKNWRKAPRAFRLYELCKVHHLALPYMALLKPPV